MNNELSYEELHDFYNKEIEKRERQKQATRKYFLENQAMRLYNTCKANAKRKGLEFSISLDDIVIPEKCPYLGVPITNILGAGRVETNASLDRIDSSLGYVKGNIQIISDLANRMKQEATKEQLISFARGVLRQEGMLYD